MSTFKNICPVPFDQQPLNEFYALKSSCFFSFFGFKLKKYLYRISIVCFISAVLFSPLILWNKSFSLNLFILEESFCSILLLGLMLLRLYLGWSYVLYRLFSATVFYEESGWYDGQIWIKTPEILTKDRLIGTYYVLPLLQRVRYTFMVLGLSLLLELFFYSLLC